jgi:hypothetical protein
MNERQKYALSKPVFGFADMLDPNRKKILHVGRLRLSTLLTVDHDGEGGFMWHASAIPIGPDNRPVRSIQALPREDRECIVRCCLSLLADVGEGEATAEPSGRGEAYHFVKDLSATELQAVKKRPLAVYN